VINLAVRTHCFWSVYSWVWSKACVLYVTTSVRRLLALRCAEDEPRLLEPAADLTQLRPEGRRTTVSEQAQHRSTSG